MTLPILFLTPAFFPEPLLWRDPPRRGGESSGLRDRDRSATMSLGNDWGQDLRTLIALAVASVVHPVGGWPPAAHGMTAVGQLSPP